ncbi:MAG: urease accessory protein UreE [Bacillota bacterium]
MILDKVIGNLNHYRMRPGERLETVDLSWEETSKRRLRKITAAGRDIGIIRTDVARFRDGDILYAGDGIVIAIKLQEAEVLVAYPRNCREMGAVCYQLGNRHFPLMILADSVICPYDHTLVPVFDRLEINYRREKRRFQEDDRQGEYQSPGHHHGHR